MRIFPLVLTCFLLSSISFGQTTLGFKIGGNLDFVESVTKGDTLTDEKNTDTFYGLHFGLSMNVPLYEDIISFSPELQLRLRSDFEDPLSTYLADVEIPLIFTCYVYPDFGIDLGPEIHYQGINASKNQEDDWFNNIEDNMGPKVFDFGISGGVRVRLAETFFIVGRFYLGLNNIYPFEEQSDNIKIRNRSAQISFIYAGRGR